MSHLIKRKSCLERQDPYTYTVCGNERDIIYSNSSLKFVRCESKHQITWFALLHSLEKSLNFRDILELEKSLKTA